MATRKLYRLYCPWFMTSFDGLHITIFKPSARVIRCRALLWFTKPICGSWTVSHYV
jgi:hypothetical protein